MKSFGVRLAAGIVTIVFGAYAAAVAQKDKQNDPQAWSVQPPPLGEPARPIAGMNEETRISLPAKSSPAQELTELAANAFAVSDPSSSSLESTNEVTLVQHTEDLAQPTEVAAMGSGSQSGGFDLSALPATLGDPEAQTPTPAAAPGFDGSAAANSGQTTEFAMPIPDWTRQSEPEASPTAALGLPDEGLAAAEVSPAQTPSTLSPNNGAAPFAFAQVPQFDSKPSPTSEFTAQQPVAASPESTVRPPGELPTNGLRGMATEVSSFEDANDSLLAQNSPQFTQPMRQPSSMVQPMAMTPGLPGSLSPAAAQPASTFPRAIPDRAPSAMPNRAASLTTQNFNDSANNQAYALQLATDPNLVFDAPGDRRLDGMQSPSIVIQKRAPPEVKVGKPAAFAIHVQNVGATDALGVRVHDRVPAGMRLVDATPAPDQQGGLLVWELGTMHAGEERTVTMKLVPEAEGELGSVARVTFEAAASVRTRSTRPELKIVQNAPRQVLIGQQLEIELEVSNPGSGEATAVSLQEDVPDGLEHPRGRQLDNLLGNMAPGEVRRQVLRLRAVAPGMITNTIRLVSEDGIHVEDAINVEVIAPDVQVDLVGPSKRFLERQATYQLQVTNRGTADATNVEISVGLDRGFTFVRTDNEGSYDPSRHVVSWSLAQLPAGMSAEVPLTLLPVEEGNRVLTMDARADLGVVARAERAVTVEGFAELTFQITNPGGPIELGAESTYEIVVTNEGSKVDSNIQVQAQLPQGIQLISAEGNGNQAQSDGRGLVAFMPLNQLAPGDEVHYHIRARGVTPGTHLIRAVVISDASPTPVTKEESTLVYADQ